MLTGLDFIRDPDDPEFHPVRDVLERNVTTQLRKILFSAFVYGALVIICLGGVVWGLAVACPNVLPIHYSSNEPVLEFPIDLLFYNFLMPLAVKFFRPSHGLHAMYTWWFRKCARMLRVTWFLFGERKVDEEGILVLPANSPAHRLPWWRRLFLEGNAAGDVNPTTWQGFFEGGKAKPNAAVTAEAMESLDMQKRHMVQTRQLVHDGRFVRAPGSDQVKIPKGRQVFLEVAEVEPARQQPDGTDRDMYWSDQYQFVYVPPHFRVRVFLFILLIWVFAAVTGVGFTIVPLIFGRRMFNLLIPAHIRTNDIYAFSIGIYILGSLAYFAFHSRSLYERFQGLVTRAIGTLTEDVFRRAAAVVVRAAKLIYSYFFLLVVFPLLAAAVMELYLLIPLHTYMYPNGVSSAAATDASNPRHTVRVIQTWTLGLLYVKLGARSITTWYGDTRLAAAVRAVQRRGWLDPEVGILTRAFIIPGLVTGVAAIGLPLVLAHSAIHHPLGSGAPHAELTPAEIALMYRLTYPATALAVGAVMTLWSMVGIFRSWKVRIRDEAYLVGERLHNFGFGSAPTARRAWRASGARL